MMNKLAYGLLSLLAVEELSGYELTQRIKLFWHTNHSAVYPQLSSMEEENLVKHQTVRQEGKPDKKLYSITSQGHEMLKAWVTSPLDDAAKKDELTFRMMCIQSMDSKSIASLLNQVRERADRKIVEMNARLEHIRSQRRQLENPSPWYKLGLMFLIQKRLEESRLETQWCDWVQNIALDSADTEAFEQNLQFRST